MCSFAADLKGSPGAASPGPLEGGDPHSLSPLPLAFDVAAVLESAAAAVGLTVKVSLSSFLHG